MGNICFYCNKEITEKDTCWFEPIDGSYPTKYGNIPFHKEKCYRTIKDIFQYLEENKERVFDFIANGSKQIVENKAKQIKETIEEQPKTKENKIKKTKKIKTKKTKRK